MKYVEEFRDAPAVRRTAEAVARRATRPWTLMEICGGQTHAIMKHGLDALLPEAVRLVHGPGCPVCVTDAAVIDHAVALARRPEVTLCSFGDMLRVPGTGADLLTAKGEGADVRAVYTPTDAVQIAAAHPERQVVLLAVGFETTAPANAMAAYMAQQQGLENFSMLVAHVLVPPAMEAILGAPDNQVQAFLAAGHVCTVMGTEAYEPLAARYRVPIVVTGFEPLDILQGVYMAVCQLEEGRWAVENQYARSVRRQGNPEAQRIIAEVFEVVPRTWRGIGELPGSGLGLRGAYKRLDAAERFGPPPAATGAAEAADPSPCIAGEVLRGLKRPTECPAFGQACTPEHPLGAPMVSGEGACAAYYRYRRAAS